MQSGGGDIFEVDWVELAHVGLGLKSGGVWLRPSIMRPPDSSSLRQPASGISAENTCDPVQAEEFPVGSIEVLHRAPDRLRANQLDHFAIGKDSDVVADIGQRLLQLAGDLAGTDRLVAPLEHSHDLPPQFVPQGDELLLHLRVFLIFWHSFLPRLGSQRPCLFSAPSIEYWTSIERIIGISLLIHQVETPVRNRDDPAVADRSNRVGKAFGAKLLAAREKAGLTQEELGYRSAIGPAQISQLELGYHTPRLDTILKLAGGLDIEPCELIADVRFKTPLAGPDKGDWVDI